LLLCYSADASQWTEQFLHLPDQVLPSLTVLGWMLTAAAMAAFPSGALSSKWGWAACLLAATSILASLPIVASWQGLDPTKLANDLPLMAAFLTFFLAFTAAMISALMALITRYRGLSDEPARQQIKWVLFSVGVTVAAMIGNLVVSLAE